MLNDAKANSTRLKNEAAVEKFVKTNHAGNQKRIDFITEYPSAKTTASIVVNIPDKYTVPSFYIEDETTSSVPPQDVTTINGENDTIILENHNQTEVTTPISKINRLPGKESDMDSNNIKFDATTTHKPVFLTEKRVRKIILTKRGHSWNKVGLPSKKWSKFVHIVCNQKHIWWFTIESKIIDCLHN